MIIDYCVLEAPDHAALTDQVRALMQQDWRWQPLGGISVTVLRYTDDGYTYTNWTFTQAMAYHQDRP